MYEIIEVNVLSKVNYSVNIDKLVTKPAESLSH